MGYFWIYYLLMCCLGAVVLGLALARNRANVAGDERRCRKLYKASLVTWHIGAILFVIYLGDLLI